MASTSTSSSTTSDESFLGYEPPTTKVAFKSDKRYHVFLSFRGPDVRKVFVDHLFEALSVAGLNVYKDDKNLEKGEKIWPSLKGAIDSSAIRVPIFSKGYADSDWCLREAAAMLDTPGLIIPLFYHLNPTHVRYPEKEPSPYRQSFQKHRTHSDRYKEGAIDQWNDALRQICERSGWSTDITDGFEGQIVKMVVNDLIKTLDRVPLEVAKHPVGLDSVKNALIQKLNLNSRDEVIKVGIWGIGGVGKTTVAKAVYNQVYAGFVRASFVINIRNTAEEPAGLTKLQEIILKNLSDYGEKVDSIDKGISLFRDRLREKRVLLVLDDVDSDEQLNALVGNWLAPGSRVIVTSRDQHIINAAQVSSECIHEMSGLEVYEGLQLFSWHAFLRASPSLRLANLSKRIVEACKGHPLSLEVIGSLLYDKQGDTDCWTEALENIILYPQIHERLYISYKALTDEEKEIFVDIACFFIGEHKRSPIVFWKSLYKKVHTAISNLSMKLLIKIDDRGLFDMHDHLRDMGRTIAEDEKKGTRKWKPSHLSTVSNNLSRLGLIGGNPQSLEMLYTSGLRYLHLQNLTIECVPKDTLLPTPQGLIWLRLKHCCFAIGKNKAVERRRYFRIVDKIWQCMQLKGCWDSSSLPGSIGNLSQLQILDLQGCERLSSLPDSIGNLSQLQILDLQCCRSLSSLPGSIGNLSELQILDLQRCTSLSSLPDSIGSLSQLQILDLHHCRSLSSLPDSIGNQSQLQKLDLQWCTSLSSLPNSIGNLSQLQILDLHHCMSLSSLPDNIGNLSQQQKLDLQWCRSLSSLPVSIGNMSQLQKLELHDCKSLSSLPNSIGNLSQLQILVLQGCERLSSFPDSIGSLSQLQKLDLQFCKSLSSLPDSIGNLSQLQKLDLQWCTSLSSLPNSIGNLSQLQILDLQGCTSLSSRPDSIGNLSQRQKLDLQCCRSLSSLPDSIGNLSQLQKLDLQWCTSLSSLPHRIGNLSQLQKLDLQHCRSLSSLPNSIGNLSQLQILDLKGCERLSSLPDSIGNLSQLQKLDLQWCRSLSSLPVTAAKIRRALV